MRFHLAPLALTLALVPGSAQEPATVPESVRDSLLGAPRARRVLGA